MSASNREFTERVTEAAVSGLEAGAGESDGHLDENLLAGYAEGRLLERERDLAEAHLARCEECREMVVMLGGEFVERLEVAPPAKGARPPTRLLSFRPGRPLLIAAGLVAALGLGLLGRRFLLGPTPSFPERVEDSVARLAGLEPELFGEIAPADPSRKRSDDPDSPGPGGDVLRGDDPRPLLPQGTAIEDRPAFVWEDAAGPVRWELLDTRGRVLLEVEGASSPLSFPADAPPLGAGETYLWKLTWGPEGAKESALASFAAANEEERRSFERARDAIRGLPGEVPRELLLAAYALHHGHLAEAERAARAALAGAPEAELPRKMLRRVLRLVGSAETLD